MVEGKSSERATIANGPRTMRRWGQMKREQKKNVLLMHNTMIFIIFIFCLIIGWILFRFEYISSAIRYDEIKTKCE